MKSLQDKINELFPVEPLPDFVSAQTVRASAAQALMPPERMTVSEAAEKYRFVNNPGGYVGPWSNKIAPYMIEPMNELTSRYHERVVFCGPAQSLKTDSLIMNGILHSIVCDPLTTLVLQTTKETARKFSRGRIANLIRDCEEVKKRQGPSRDDDNVHDKRFKGMDLFIESPTINNLSGTPIPRVFFTDYDRMDTDLGGEGEPFDLGHTRSRSFGSRRMTAAESSPGRPVLKANWKPHPDRPHEAPPTTGILALYNRGDRRRRYWYCPECGEPFEPRFNLLQYPVGPDVPIEVSAQKSVMVCPHNGCFIEHEQKNTIDTQGIWLKEGQTTNADREIIGEGLQSKIASFWVFGVVAALASWDELVRNYLSAVAEYERTNIEDTLKTTINVDQAEPYLPKAMEDVETVSAPVLEDRAKREEYRLKTVPDGVRFLTAAVDTQDNRFEVKVEGWGIDGENWTIDYFKIFKSADGDRMLDPTQFKEDWDLLFDQVVLRAYPLADGSGRAMPIWRSGVDMHGSAGVSEQAYNFWRRAKKKGLRDKVRLFRGDPLLKHERWRESYPDSQRKDRKAGARGEVPVYGFNSNKLKDEVFSSLKRSEPGPGYRHHSKDLVDDKTLQFFDQMTAEERVDDKWKAVKARNEAWDLSYYNRALWLILKADRIEWSGSVPSWAATWDKNTTIVTLEVDEKGTYRVPEKTERRKLSSLLA